MALGRSLSFAAYLALARRGPREALTFACARPEGALVWGHATSAERGAALVQIAARLRVQRPGLNMLITTHEGLARPDHMTDLDIWQALPEDSLSSGQQFLEHWRPDLCIWTGGHLKPALISLTEDRDMPMILIDVDEEGLNATRQRWLPELHRRSLDSFSTIMARNGSAAQALRRAGVPRDEVEVTGPMQTGGGALPCSAAEREEMAQILAGRPIWLAAMAQREELDIIIEAHRQVSRIALRLLLILVPDDESDGVEFAEVLEERGMRTAVWSEGDLPDETTQVLLADTYGEMGLWYRLAPVTLMAKSLTPQGQGGDPYEPAALGSAILYGPNVSRYLSTYSRFAAAGAAKIVNDTAGLAGALELLLAPERAAAMAAAGWELSSEGAEVTDRVIDLVHDTLDALGVD
ncbi:3-deoxy-D-manno-octulosonic acid transferase [Rhodalgimonas zhirmunskyi]|uniref:3-deoxy-D-manno-octulosonic acid transferase n=1 Tax=Rhodalgimonas zhirmunskyi TaxID=2964767 RepID=A0AAJ1UE86_9RHOB|nr:glycosyltransferase N-terminal domain-containing protein [Rhodoalgimonas zhirmunskyi]MDQ2094407.1 3-deoxy-D-manno-octulosonic acid transferase [Rhodoalgimonas zhirmunskyi]